MPGIDGIEYCASSRSDPQTRDIPVVLLTGSERADLDGRAPTRSSQAVQPARAPRGRRASRRRHERRAAAPRSAARVGGAAPPLRARPAAPVEVERQQRALLNARVPRHRRRARGRARVEGHGDARALASACSATRSSSRDACAPELLEDPSIEYGFLLHDVGKIGVPDSVLQKPAPLTDPERRLIETHTIARRADARGRVVPERRMPLGRSLASRALGRQRLPRRARRDDIPLGARVFAVADALDAITSNRPYRSEQPWASRGRRDLRAGRQAVRPRGRRSIPRARRRAARDSRARSPSTTLAAWTSS